jgi:AmiR/NasT family two-component response regulator
MPAALSVLVVADPETHGSGEALALADALSAAGYLVLGVRSGDASLPEAVQHLKPDVLVVRSDSAVRDVLEHIVIATRAERRPIVMFTDSADKPTMRQALGAGVSAYVVKGLKADRVQAVVDVAVERFAADEALRATAGRAGRTRQPQAHRQGQARPGHAQATCRARSAPLLAGLGDEARPSPEGRGQAGASGHRTAGLNRPKAEQDPAPRSAQDGAALGRRTTKARLLPDFTSHGGQARPGTAIA